MAHIAKNFGAAAEDYQRHRAGFPDSLFEHLAARGIGLSEQRIVDLGTGTGSLARGFARRGCRVIGLDPDERMLASARELDGAAGVRIEYRVATAEATGLNAGCADVVSAGQCWHWFAPEAATREVNRILVPDGRLAIAHFDWIPLRGNLVEQTERLIREHNPAWQFGGGSGLHPSELRDLAEAHFRNIESFSFDLDAPYTHEAWRGRIRASAGVGAALTQSEIATFDAALESMLAKRFPEATLVVPHRVFVVTALCPR